MTIPPEPCDVLKGRKTKMRSLTKVMFGAAAMLALAGFAALPAAAQTPDYAAGLVKPGTITIATTGNAPPITQVQPDGSISGFDIELCQKIASDLGLATEIVRVDFAATIPGLTAGRFDMICSSTARTKQRLESPDLYMTVPTLQNFTTLLLRAESHVLDNRHAAERLRQLERADHARTRHLRGGQALEGSAIKRAVTLLCHVESGEQVEEGGLTGTVGADERRDRVPLRLEVVDVNGNEAAERTHHAVSDEDGIRLLRAGLRLNVGE